MSTQISNLKVDIRQAVEALKRDLNETRSWILKESEVPTKNTADVDPDVRRVLAATLADCPSNVSDIAISLILLDSLDFEQRKFKHSKIQKAHPGTFEWVFSTKFKSWLQASDPIFWISGKPGSGKSTLMKHLVDNSRTSTALSSWSGSHKLVIADYYFWINGTDLQRSQEGLFRALLHDILCRDPKLIKRLLPEAWQSISSRLASGIPMHSAWNASTWTRESLLEACQRLSTIDDINTKFCIFIDGLDEYDGDHEDLIQTIRCLTKLKAKLCVASRPWNVFEDTFGSNPQWKLYLQDLNKPDMQRYVNDKLRSQPNFQMMERTQADGIVNEIVEKSQGVFLWVYLVVRSLSEGLRNRDGLPLLQKRLREFPSDLDQFFRHIFLSLEVVYRVHLSHMLQVALTAVHPLSLFAYWLLDEIEDDPDMVRTMPVNSPRFRDISQMEDEMAVRINGRCKGLLEVTYPRVDFLHRTVKDFLMTTEMQRMILDWQRPDFNPNLTICNVLLAESRCGHRSMHNIPYLSQESFDTSPSLEDDLWEWLPHYVDAFKKIFAEHVRLCPEAQRPELWRAWGLSSALVQQVVVDPPVPQKDSEIKNSVWPFLAADLNPNPTLLKPSPATSLKPSPKSPHQSIGGNFRSLFRKLLCST